MIIGEFTAGVKILLEKDCQDTIFLKASNSMKILRSSYFARRRR
jgi:hypothetical protein